MQGRPVIYIPAKNHSVNDREIDELTKFIVYCLVICLLCNSFLVYQLNIYSNLQEEASKKSFEDVIDNFCIVFDLKNFSLTCMDYPLIKNLIWLLSRHYPERLGVCLIYNSPTVFSGCWAVIRGWLDENTAGKVTFVNSEEELCSYLIPDILPTDIWSTQSHLFLLAAKCNKTFLNAPFRKRPIFSDSRQRRNILHLIIYYSYFFFFEI